MPEVRDQQGTAAEDASMDLVVPLDDPRAVDPSVTGSKAATLARLRAAGHPVPDGFVVPTGACERLAAAGGGSGIGSAGADAATDRTARDELAAALADLGGGPVAARSSAVAEDLAGASYAGQYETVLDVRGPEELWEAVATCVASVSSERVQAYAGDPGSGSATAAPGSMAVLVQRQVAAEAAGAAFSANPVTGNRDETLVSAVRGLGERLVSGEANPDEWVVRDAEADCEAAPEGAVTETQVLAIASLAEELEDELGAPQDIEWAIATGSDPSVTPPSGRQGSDDGLLLLQARPITALPRKPDLRLPAEGTWTKDRAHYAEQMTPLGASIFLPVLDAGINQMFADYGLLMERIDNISMGGEIYGHVTPVGGKEGPPPPWWVLAILARIVPAMRRRMRAARQVVESGRLEDMPHRWVNEWRAEFRHAAAELRSVDLAELDDAALEAHLDQGIDLLEYGQHVHFQLFIPYAVGIYELARACEELLGWEAHEALELVSGLSETSTEPARALADLAQRIRAHPGIAADGVDSDGLVIQVRANAPELAAGLDDYVDRYAHRATNYDPGAPTLAERPELIASLLRDAVAAADDPDGGDGPAGDTTGTRRRAEERAADAVAQLPPEERERFEAALDRAREVYGLREDNVFWTDNMPSGLIRRAAIEAGRRLAARGQLARAEDVAYLQIGELREGLADPGQRLDEPATHRRAAQAWVAAHPGPQHRGDEPAPMPDVRGLPESGRRINEAMIWFFGAEYFTPDGDAEADLAGVPGSSGRYTGTARVITGPDDFGRLRPGDVLVAPITTPDWSVLFGPAGAVVTDTGGALSHAAVVAREHGIPAVLNTGEGTTALKDGQVVAVDGAAGTVRLVDETVAG